MKQLLLVWLALVCVSSAFAHRDRLGKVSQAVLTFEDGGTVILTRDRVAVLSLALRTDVGAAEVKKEDLSGIDHPQLDSIHMTGSTFTGGDLAGVSYKAIRFRFGAEERKSFGEYPEVSFHFYDGKYHHRELRMKTSPTSWSIESPDGGGTVSVLENKANQPSQPTPLKRRG